MKAIVVYYSYTGKTELVAKAVAGVTGAELRKIEEVKKRKGILGFIRGGKEAVLDQRVAIKPVSTDWGEADTVFIGCPLWAATAPPALKTFLDQVDFGGRKVIAFCTYGGSSTDKLRDSMQKLIEAKHGEFLDFFAIQTGGAKHETIIRQGEEQAKKYI